MTIAINQRWLIACFFQKQQQKIDPIRPINNHNKYPARYRIYNLYFLSNLALLEPNRFAFFHPKELKWSAKYKNKI